LTESPGDAYRDEDASLYQLPTADTLRRWQEARDMLEEAVLAFDGGDLGRMKAKTRGELRTDIHSTLAHIRQK
jgi:hypothetical protein